MALMDGNGLTVVLCDPAIGVALAEAAERRLRVTVAMLDAGDTLPNVVRMDRIRAGGVEVAAAKVRYALTNQDPTRVLCDLFESGVTGLSGVLWVKRSDRLR